MTNEQDQTLVCDERTERAIDELENTIRRRYPTALFELSPSPEDPHSIHITAIVDVDDPDEVGDLVVERVIDLNVEEGIRLHVIPVRTPERIAADKRRHKGRRRLQPLLLSKIGLLGSLT